MSLRRKLTTVRRLGPRAVTLTILQALWDALYTDRTVVVFAIDPKQVNPVVPQLIGEHWSMGSDTVATYREPGALPDHVASELASAPAGQRIHWVKVGSRTASWGFSTPWQGPWPLTETKSHLVVSAGGVCLTAFETLPDFRGRRLYPSVLTAILVERFAEGATRAHIWCRHDNRASYRAIKLVGFRETAVHRYRRVLGVTRRTETSVE